MLNVQGSFMLTKKYGIYIHIFLFQPFAQQFNVY